MEHKWRQTENFFSFYIYHRLIDHLSVSPILSRQIQTYIYLPLLPTMSLSKRPVHLQCEPTKKSTFFRYFPDSIKNQASYLRFLKQLTYFTISTIFYNWQGFDDAGNYKAKWHGDLAINILKPDAVDPCVRRLVQLLVSATSLIEKKKLKQLFICFLEDLNKSDEYVEMYCLEYKYVDDYSNLDDLPSKCIEIFNHIEREIRAVEPEKERYFVIKINPYGEEKVELEGFHDCKSKKGYLPDHASFTSLGMIEDIFSISKLA